MNICILVYAGVEQDLNKKPIAIRLLENHVQNNNLQLSLLTLQEYSFTYAKLKIDNAITQQDIYYYSSHVKHLITKEIFLNAIELCSKIDFLSISIEPDPFCFWNRLLCGDMNDQISYTVV